jgi:tetratricopeptide (TPR) repeat protein
MARLTAGLLIACLMAGVANAQSLLVIGETPAARCYEHARWARAHYSSLNSCDEALAADDLPLRDRQRTWVNRAVINLHLGEAEIALRDLDQAVELGFDSPEIAMNQSAALIRLSRYEEAIEAATLALDTGLRDVEKAYFNRAVAYERVGRIAEAYDDFRAASEAAPTWVAAQEQLERFRVSNGT